MGETAEERARRLRQIGGGESWYHVSNLIMDFDYTSLYPEINPCAEIIIDEVCDEPTVSLVKEYSKGSFKFV